MAHGDSQCADFGIQTQKSVRLRAGLVIASLVEAAEPAMTLPTRIHAKDMDSYR